MDNTSAKNTESVTQDVEAAAGSRDIQRALLNMLDDFDTEKVRLERTQRATINILDDFNAEKTRLEGTQRAVLNILDDFDAERSQLASTQKATLNILEDFNDEKERLVQVQRAVLNILEDFDAERNQLGSTQKATLNILEDFNAEKLRLEDTQRAVLNILDDFNTEKTKVEQANILLQMKSEELNRSNAELQQAHAVLEQRVAERTADLKQSNKELESFSYTVSHDLRAPLRSMDGFSRALLEDYADKLDEQGKKWLSNIRTSSQLMAQLINDILGLSRVVRVEMRVDKVNLSDQGRSVAERLKASEPGRSVEFVIQEGMRDIGDGNLLRLVLENLLGNAFKFTARCRNARIEFGMAERDGKKAYYVRDNGAGFDMKFADKLFKPFQRLHTDKDFAGTGIGLVTVQRIVRRHGGEVWAEGEAGKGATFYFTLNMGVYASE